MRMWDVNVKKMCRKHLLGEHVEMHMFKGTIEKGKDIKGYLLNKLVNIGFIKDRHDKLVKEMIRRGYKHNSPMKKFNENGSIKTNIITIDVKNNIQELKKRCNLCYT